jgi:hypothetical protein
MQNPNLFKYKFLVNPISDDVTINEEFAIKAFAKVITGIIEICRINTD